MIQHYKFNAFIDIFLIISEIYLLLFRIHVNYIYYEKIVYLFVLICFYFSCSSNILEEVQSIPKSRSIGYEPTWWNSTERLPAPSEYWSGYRDTPYDVATIDTCAGYVSLVYSWGFSYDWQYYHRCKFNIEKFLMGMNIFSLYRNLSGSG